MKLIIQGEFSVEPNDTIEINRDGHVRFLKPITALHAGSMIFKVYIARIVQVFSVGRT